MHDAQLSCGIVALLANTHDVPSPSCVRRVETSGHWQVPPYWSEGAGTGICSELICLLQLDTVLFAAFPKSCRGPPDLERVPREVRK